MPHLVHDWVAGELGSAVVWAEDQTGGFSPGCATRIRCADGTRAFVKAVGRELNPDTPTLFRREIEALNLLGSHPLWDGLRSSYDDGAWVAILLEDVEGTRPDLADDATMDRLLEATDELVGVMQARVPRPPSITPHEGNAMFRPGLVDLAAVFRGWAAGLDHAPDLPDGLVPRWLVDGAGRLRDDVLALADQPADHLVHWDIRDDNLLQRPGCDLVFLDWGACGVGPGWLDPLLARLERVHLPWFDTSLTTSPSLARAGDEVITSWLVGIGSFLALRAHTAVDLNLPTLGEFRRTESARFLAAGRRLGFGA